MIGAGALRRVAAASGVLLLVACGDNNAPTTPPPPSTGVTVEADGTQVISLSETDQYRFQPEEPHVTPGKVRIDFANTSNTNTHSLAFKPGGPTVEIPYINPRDSKSISFEISTPGEYDFFCTFHEALGQRGVLVVDPA